MFQTLETAEPLRIGAAWPSKLARALARSRVQWFGALLIGVIGPGLFRWPSVDYQTGYAGIALRQADIVNSLCAGIVAATISLYLIRKMQLHRGLKSLGLILSATSLSYGVVGLFFLLFRAEYSRYQLVASFLLTSFWLVFANAFTSWAHVSKICVVPKSHSNALPFRRNFSWIYLVEPIENLGELSGVVVDFDISHGAEWERFLARCALSGMPIYDWKTILEEITGKVEINHISESTFVSTVHGLIYSKLKRFLDIVLALLLFPSFASLIALAAAAIFICDGGPIFFTQERVGYRGRPFRIYKLRTMVSGGDLGHAFTAADDNRITRVGRFLRTHRLDELPQIWNVLKGDMSWIGPRPESIRLAEVYEREVPLYAYRHIVRPGLSGWAQVNQGNVGDVEAAREKLFYDFYYIKHLSLWLDLFISIRTLGIVTSGFGSH